MSKRGPSAIPSPIYASLDFRATRNVKSFKRSATESRPPARSSFSRFCHKGITSFYSGTPPAKLGVCLHCSYTSILFLKTPEYVTRCNIIRDRVLYCMMYLESMYFKISNFTLPVVGSEKAVRACAAQI